MRFSRFFIAAFAVGAVPAVGVGDEGLGVVRPVVVPQVGVLQRDGKPPLTLDRVTATIDVRGSSVTTQLDVHLSVKGKSPVACDVLVPLPARAELLSVLPRGDGSAKERAGFEFQTGTAAKGTFRSLAVNLGDASVLEFYGSSVVLVRSLTFSGGEKPVVQVRYRETAGTALQNPGFSKNPGLYQCPRSERLQYATPWGVSAAIHPATKPMQPVTAAYCASHPVTTARTSDGTLTANVRGNATAEPGPFRLSWTTAAGGVTGLVLAYPPRDGEDGFFLWMLQAPSFPRDFKKSLGNDVKREITLVIDRSASMDGQRIGQVRTAANGVLGTLQAGDSFNIVTYNQAVDVYAKSPVANTAANVAAAKTYLNNIQPRGGSNIYDALKTSLAQPRTDGRLPIVLFFTDGLPTSGSPSEVKIRNLAVKENPHGRRIYTVGIGVDLLSPLLNGLSTASGGRSVFVLPKEDVAAKVAPVLDRLQQPVMTDPKIAFRTADGKEAGERFHRVLPSRVPDLFAGDQVVILGRYRGTQPAVLTVTGNHLGTTKSFRFSFDPKTASASHTFLPRLWASRRIGQLVETIRQEGAQAPAAYSVRVQKTDPRLARRSKEVLELTARYGVLTEYTAFLSQGKLAQGPHSQLLSNFAQRAVRTRSGTGSVNQETNNSLQHGQVRLNSRNRYWNAEMNCVDVGTVQQIGTLALFRRGDRWIDGRLLIRDPSSVPRDFKKSLGTAAAATTVQFGTREYWNLLDKLSLERQQGALALGGDVLLLHDGKPLLVTAPKPAKGQYVPATNIKVK